jgi:hypothetical protein
LRQDQRCQGSLTVGSAEYDSSGLVGRCYYLGASHWHRFTCQWLERSTLFQCFGAPLACLSREISATISTELDYAGLFSVQPLALSGENKVPMVRVEQFLAGCWCSTRSKICRSVQRYRPKISWSVSTYRLDWIVVSYSRVATGAFWDTLLVVASGRTRPGKDRCVHSLLQRY